MTAARILAELFAERGCYPIAQLILIAAARATSAPLIAGPDVTRYQHLQEELARHLSAEARAGISALALGLPRTEVIARTQNAIATLD